MSASTSTATPYTVRSAAQTDLAGVRELLAVAALPTDGLEEQFGNGYAVAVAPDGTVIGAEGIEVYGAYGLLRSAVVDPAWRGRGVGDALTQHRLRWAASAGVSELYLLTTTAAEYFPRFGFVPVAREGVPAEIRASREFASVCPSTATVMRLELRAANDTREQ